MDRKIAVLGTGANGASIAADLTEAGLDVVLIDQWPQHVEAMLENGITIRMPEETRVVPVRAIHLCDVCTLDYKFDIIILVMKAYDTPWACHLIKPYLKDNGILVGAQNGMTIDAIAEVVGVERTMGCVIEITSQMFEPGIVDRQSPHERSWFAVGGMGKKASTWEAEVRNLLSNSGVAIITNKIESAKWMKLISNSTTLATSAIFGLPMAEAAKTPKFRQIMLAAGAEALAAGQEAGYEIEPIFGLTEKEVHKSNQLVALLLDKVTSSFILPETITTILQDQMKNRKSEVGDINGWVVTTSEEFSRKAPINSAIVEISKRIKCGELKASTDNLQLLNQLAAQNTEGKE
ncbi:MAG: 2-dehydropantoate 2-reductase N-terminal domain-containing protein [Pseudomonadota bacterium]|nr:2-dehydropantoate 2-reductase N-terminal domain-containing protein [Pseudomonadota bacterium]